MSSKKTSNGSSFLASMGVAVLASAISGGVAYWAAYSYAESEIDRIADQIKASQSFDKGLFEDRVEEALESIVEKRKKQNANAQSSERSAESSLSMNDKGQVVYGNPDAKYTIYTFSDFRCSYCTKFHPVVESVVDSSDGEVNFIYKPYPVLGPASQSLAKAGECVAQEEGPEAFWRYAERAYATKNWITAIAQSGLSDVENIKSCVEQNRYGKRITASINDGQELNVTGTPASVFRNNETERGAFIPGYIDAGQIAQMLEEVN
jgi:protein-disulfide isomerase